MSNGIHLTAYHDAVRQWLKDNVDWLASVEYYPEVDTALATPCGFFAVLDWDPSDDQPMNGQLAVDLNCELLAVLGMADEKYQLEVRNAAMALSLKIHESRFGLSIEPAVFIGAEPDEFNPELDDYAVWAIKWTQRVEVGEDQFKPEGLTPGIVRVGYSPDVGSNNIDKYEQVVRDG